MGMKENQIGAKKQYCPYANSLKELQGFGTSLLTFSILAEPQPKRGGTVLYLSNPVENNFSCVIRGKIRLLAPLPRPAPSPDTAPEVFSGSTFSSKLDGMKQDLGMTGKILTGHPHLKMPVAGESGKGTEAINRICFTCLTPCKIKAKSSPPKRLNLLQTFRKSGSTLAYMQGCQVTIIPAHYSGQK